MTSSSTAHPGIVSLPGSRSVFAALPDPLDTRSPTGEANPNSLAGPYPERGETAAEPGKNPSPEGLCGIATHDALGVQAALADIGEQLDRLERALP